MWFLSPRKAQMIKRVYVFHFQESLLQFKWFMYPSFTKRKTTSLLFALLKPSSVQLIILLSGKKGKFISNSLTLSMGISYGIIKIPYLTSREKAPVLIFSPVWEGGAGGRRERYCPSYASIMPCGKFQEKKWAKGRSEGQEYFPSLWSLHQHNNMVVVETAGCPPAPSFFYFLSLYRFSEFYLYSFACLHLALRNFITCEGLCPHQCRFRYHRVPGVALL